MTLDKRFYVLVGNYGSGKTELALSLARDLRRQRTGRVALVDLDIVNPYFRSAEQKTLLEGEGIEVLMPSFAMTTVDIPALPAQIASVFELDYAAVVIDVGGDDTGAVALGGYAHLINRHRAETDMWYVVNPYRPLSSNAAAIEEMYTLIAQRARVTPDVLVNNANLQTQTTAECLLEGERILVEVSQALGVPLGPCVGEEKLRPLLPPDLQSRFYAITPLMRPQWLEDGQ